MVENSMTPEEVNDHDDYSMGLMLGASEPHPVRVIDLIDPNIPRANEQQRAERMSICRSCDKFRMGTLCSECNCIMKFKTWLSPATCPIHKW
jgi:hypothetical protein